ncbi:MAG: flagellar protein [Lachnospiraceae bacterium]|nr:flagellar protein [Lachnospiraceae bacterium]
MDINNFSSNNFTSNYTSIEQVTGQYLKTQNSRSVDKTSDGLSFEEVLHSKKTELKFSKHADARLSERNISLSDEQLQRLNNGAKKAGAKGIDESLMIMDDLAFIVNVKNNTVVTAIDSTASEDNVFTNIDGAVIV